MCVRCCTRNGVLRVDWEFPNYDFVITREKDSEDKGSVPEFVQSSRGITSQFDKTIRNTFFNHSSSAPTLSTVSLLTTTANSISKTNTVLPHFGEADSHGQKRVAIVDWLYNHRHRSLFRQSIQKNMGGSMSRDQNRGSVVQEGTRSMYQSAGTFCHKVCHLDICRNVENVSCTYPGRQFDSLELFVENGRDKEYRTNPDLKGNLAVSTWAGDHDYCQTFTRESQLQGRISARKWILRMETVPSNFQENMPNIGEETKNRSVCFKVFKSASKLLLLEARCQQSWHRCFSTGIVSQQSICMTSICLDSQST